MSKFLKIFAPTGVGIVGILSTAYILADQFVVDVPAPARGRIVTPALAESHGEEQMAEDTATVAQTAMAAPEGGYGLGREALAEEVAAWDIDVRPDGLGLPEGSGDVMTGEGIYLDNCAMCHGDFGEAIGRWPVIAGGEDTLATEDPIKTVGSYWPFASTIFDYVHRAMPFGNAQSLTDDEVYALTAYILYLNYIVEDDFVLSRENFAEVKMPNEDNFFMDDRAETELGQFSEEPCMTDCKETVEITARARVLDVTPESAGVADEEAAAEPGAEEAGTEVAEAETAEEAPAEEMAEEEAEAPAGPDPELVADGEKVFRKCRSCHQVGEGAANRTGPHLNGVMGRAAGSVDGFRYSKAMEEAAEGGLTWTPESLAEFLADPRGYMRGTKMSFAGLRKEEDIAAITAYLSTLGE